MKLNPLTFYKCLAEETRLKSLLLLTLKGELCVCDLTVAMDLSQPKVSRHLSELRKSEVISDDKRGKWVYYRLHRNLPSWAKTVLVKTAAQNPSYIERNLSLLERNTISPNRCVSNSE